MKAAVVGTESEIASIHSTLSGTAKPYQVLTAFLSKREDAQRIPGKVGDRLVFRQAVVTNCASAGTTGAAPAPVGINASAAKVRVTENIVLYMRAPKHFCEQSVWASFEKAPAKAALQWVANRHIQALDAFSWAREKSKSGDSEQFFGHVRVARQDVGPLIAASGQQGIFIAAPRSAPAQCLPRCDSVWIDRAPQEKHGAYLDRIMRMADAHGIAMLGTRLGWRRPLAKDETPTRIWQITEVPVEWDHAAVKGMLEVAFVDPVVISHRWQKGSVSLRLRARIKTGNGDRDVVPIVAEHLGANITLWATYAPATQTVQKSVYTHSAPVVAAEAAPAFTKTTESVPVSTASPPDAEVKEQSQTKQAKQEIRSFPTDLDKVDCAKDGNCVLHAFSKALKHFKDEDRHPRVLRAELVTHMLKHERHSRTWDKLDPSGNRLESFEEHCKIIERDGVHLGELEISALAHITHFKVVVVLQGLDFQPTAWNTKGKKLIVLWYSASHSPKRR